MHKLFLMIARDDSGQGLVEYALVIVLVAVAAIAAMTFLGSKTNNTLNNAASMIP